MSIFRNLLMTSGEQKEYKLVDYIQSTGEQFIDTGVKANGQTNYEIKFAPHTKYTSWGGYLAGDKNAYRCPKIFCDNDVTKISIETNSSHTSQYYYLVTTQADTPVTIKTDGSKIYVDGSHVATLTRQSGTNSYSYYLSRGHEESGNKASMRIYYCKFWQDGELIRDLIPVIDKNNVACMYDLVNEQYYYNGGTGNFTYGSIIG